MNKKFIKVINLKSCPICETTNLVECFILKGTKYVKCSKKSCSLQLSYSLWNKIKRRVDESKKYGLTDNTDESEKLKIGLEKDG